MGDATIDIDDSDPGRVRVVVSTSPIRPIFLSIYWLAAAAVISVFVFVAGVDFTLRCLPLWIVAFLAPVLMSGVREDYLLNTTERTLTRVLLWRWWRVQSVVSMRDVAAVRLYRKRGEDDLYRLSLVDAGGRSRLRLPSLFSELFRDSDCRRIGRSMAAALRVPLLEDTGAR
jgi:hypothetical protein